MQNLRDGLDARRLAFWGFLHGGYGFGIAPAAKKRHKPDMRLSCYIYKEGRDFAFTPALRKLRFHPSFLAMEDEEKTLHPHPEIFVETLDPQAAHLFLFPLDIGVAVDFGLAGEIEQILASLPYLSGREERHLVSDMADRLESVSLGVCLFKVSVTEDSGMENRVVIMGYPTPPHSGRSPPEIWVLTF